MMGKGLVFNEGEEWRRKRKIISELFTFELILNKLPRICELSDVTLDMVEEKTKIGEDQYAIDVKELGVDMFSSMVM